MSELIVKKVTFGDNSSQQTAADRSFRNKIINGDMAIDQERAGAAITPGLGASYVMDQWATSVGTASKLTFQQVADAPAGFKYSQKITVAAQYTPGAGEPFILYHPIEGLNCIDLEIGLTTAKTITISFWVKGSVPGTYNVSLSNSDGTRTYVGTYTVTTVWSKQTVTLVGCVDGVWDKSTNIGLSLRFDLGSGSSWVSTGGIWESTNRFRTSAGIQLVNQPNGSTLNITGVQLERAGAASEFEHVPYAEQLRRCQRYFQWIPQLCNWFAGPNYYMTNTITFEPMRNVPTVGVAVADTFQTGSTGNLASCIVMDPTPYSLALVFTAMGSTAQCYSTGLRRSLSARL